MKTGSRNDMIGEVVELRQGEMMGVAKVRIPAGAMVSSVMTSESLAELDLQPGDQVRVLIKAVNVLLLKE